MKATRTIEEEIEIASIEIEVPVRYGVEDIPQDFPLRVGDIWRAVIEIDTGKIKDWPNGKSGRLAMKVTDSGTYRLLGADGSELACIDGDYVPHGIVPGEYGDYIALDINENGIVTNWPKNPRADDFFEG